MPSRDFVFLPFLWPFGESVEERGQRIAKGERDEKRGSGFNVLVVVRGTQRPRKTRHIGNKNLMAI